ncbi:MAG: hypothetical protein AAGK74_00145 [Chloroflexota bacterium]
MADLKETFRALVAATATGLTGGVYLLRDQGNQLVSPSNQSVVYAADGISINPFAVIHFRQGISVQAGPYERVAVAINFYEQTGYAAIDTAIDALKPALGAGSAGYGNQQVSGDDGSMFVRWLSFQSGFRSSEFNDASRGLLLLEANIWRTY